MQIGTSMGAHMVLMTTPCYQQIEEPNGSVFPEDNPRRVLVYNQIVREVAAKFPSTVTVQDLYSLACPRGVFQADLGGAQNPRLRWDPFPGSGSGDRGGSPGSRPPALVGAVGTPAGGFRWACHTRPAAPCQRHGPGIVPGSGWIFVPHGGLKGISKLTYRLGDEGMSIVVRLDGVH